MTEWIAPGLDSRFTGLIPGLGITKCFTPIGFEPGYLIKAKQRVNLDAARESLMMRTGKH